MAALMLGSTSCDKLTKAASSITEAVSDVASNGVKFSTTEGLNTIVKSLEKNNSEQFHIYGIRMIENDEFSGSTNDWSLELVDKNDQVYNQCFYADGRVGDLDTRMNSKISPRKWDSPYLTPDKINVEALVKALDEIKAMTPEGYTFKSISDINIESKEIRVYMRVTKDGEETVTNAGKTQQIYYEGSYIINPETWEITEKN